MTTQTANGDKNRAGISRHSLLTGASVLVLGLGVAVAPAHAQLARLRAVLGGAVVPTQATTVAQRAVAARNQSMQQALAVQAQRRATVTSLRSLVTAARTAALAATHSQPTDGLSAKGLNPAVTAPVRAVDDATGLATWQGAGMPTQTVADGRYTVTVDQTESRAVLSWNRFDVGANTTLNFNQKLNGAAQTGWVVLNRVVDPAASPTTILGQIKADGTVIVLNRSGVLFGKGAQVNTHSLLASSLDIGNFGRDPDAGTVGSERLFRGLTIKDRNTAFLDNGILGGSATPIKFDAMLTSALVSGTGNYSFLDPNAAFSKTVEGAVTVERGASLTASRGGYIILTAPTISNDGTLTAPDGQVSLQAGRAITYTVSTGAANGADADIRGLIVRSATETGGSVVNSGLIDVPRGYVSLGADLTGTVTNSGLIASTTSVARNGVVSLTAGHVVLAGGTAGTGGAIAILPDSNGETVPQGTAAEPPAFKASRIDIGGAYVSTLAGPGATGLFGPAAVEFGANTLVLAPNATVSIGGRASETYTPGAFAAVAKQPLTGSITVASGAVIDVSGVKGVELAASRNEVTISPLKGNELRDTPNYRDVTTNGAFTLNGQTVMIDPRKSGVRADGVAWIGSPLIEAGSAASQIAVTAPELMTKGGTVSLKVAPVLVASDAASAPRVAIAAGATVDFTGGWTHYAAGTIRSTRLVRADGSIVDIADADPNGDYIGVAGAYESTQSRFGLSTAYANRILSGERFEAAYDEGRDAGALVIGASTASLGGTVDGRAWAGQHQLEKGSVGTAGGQVTGDPRHRQASTQQLPNGGFMRVGSIFGSTGVQLGGDIVVAPGGAATSATAGAFVLSDATLNAAGLSALTLQTSGGIRFEAGTNLALEAGGALTLDAGRTIRLDGNVAARGGRIVAQTVEMGGIVQQALIAATGSPFTTDDDLTALYASATGLPRPFDIVVDGTLDVSGRWNNDYAATLGGDFARGTAWTDGGTIALQVAPKVFVALGEAEATASSAVDLSGSITLGEGALLNVSSGGQVTSSGAFNLVAKGGNVSLINQTVYASLIRTDAAVDENSSTEEAINGANQTVTFTPVSGVGQARGIRSALVPLEMRSGVSFDPANLRGFSFGGGGTFTLVAPDVSFGSATGGTHIGLDFLQRTGFGELAVRTYRSRLFGNLFNNGIEGNSAILETTRFVIGAGETLDLNQALMPYLLDTDQARTLLTLDSDADITAVLTPSVPIDAWDQRAAKLSLGGLTELQVAKGGRITGAAGAAITTPKLLNQGTIRIMGGSIDLVGALPESLVGGAIGVRDASLGGRGLDAVLGGRVSAADADPQYDENATALVPVNGADVTNRALFSTSGADRAVYFLGVLDAETGIRLDAGSETLLGGGVVLNPRAQVVRGQMLRTGTLYDGGRISTAAALQDSANVLFATSALGGSGRYAPQRGGSSAPVLAPVAGLTLDAAKGSLIDLSGAATELDIAVAQGQYQRTPQWTRGGSLRVLAGGTLTDSTLRAAGGTAAAEGGTLEWLRPTLAQSGGPDLPAGALTADWIEDSGFSTFVARGSLALDGSLDLHLGKAFILSSAPLPTGAAEESTLRTSVSLSSAGNAVIRAPYVRLSSTTQRAGGGTSTATGGSITFRADTIDLVGGVSFIVPGGDAAAGIDPGKASLVASNAIRFIGVPAPGIETQLSGLTGAVVSTGDLAFTAGQIYATTGTGNLQQLIEERRDPDKPSAATPYIVASLAEAGTVSFASNGGAVPAAPLSAGSWVRVLGNTIVQDGVLRAPLGLLEIGSSTVTAFSAGLVPATQSITFGAGSVTSVSGEGLNVPYGTTTDLTEYYFTPNTSSALTAAPVGEMRLEGDVITVASGAKIDGRGGGDVFAFEFVSGTGGSRDVLSRLNTDNFSANAGLQYADGRQVFAILPVSQAGTIAAYDPLFSADYGAGTGDIYGAQAGRTVWLDGGNGVAAGEYLLLPAHYALLPGALRLVESTDVAAPFADNSALLRDGSVVLGGTYGTAGTGYRESTRHAFTVQSADVFRRYSKLATTSGTTTFVNLAKAADKSAPRSPLDAARFLINPAQALQVDGTFVTDPATGGRGAQFDIAASVVEIRNALPGGGATAAADPGALVLTTGTLAKLNANSLLIGGTRSDNVDGTTSLAVLGRDIAVDNGVSLALPELLIAVGGAGSSLRVDAGARLSSTGTLSDTQTGNFVVGYQADGQSVLGADNSGIGALLRVSSGGLRGVTRTTNPALADSALANTRLLVASGASLTGTTLGFDSSGRVGLGDTATIAATNIGLGAVRLDLSAGGLDSALVARLAGAQTLALQSQKLIALGADLPVFNNLIVDGPGFLSAGADVALKADTVTLRNSGQAAAGCSTSTATACGAGAAIAIDAEQIALGNGTVRFVGFEGGATLAAAKGLYVQGTGTLEVDDAAAPAAVKLTLRTPFVADRSATDTLDVTTGGADYTFLTTGKILVDGAGRTGTPTTSAQAAGSIISFGTNAAQAGSITIKDAAIRATSGIVNAYARTDIAVSGTASIAVPGFSTTIGSASDPIVATAGSGTINLQSARGDLTIATGTTLVSDTGTGDAGTLNLVAGNGTITLGATLNAGIAAGKDRKGSILLDGGSLATGDGTAFDFARFLSGSGHLFHGAVQVHTGTGDLAIDAGQTLRAEMVTLATDHGTLSVAGTIDTSGESVAGLKMGDAAYAAARVNGGDIALYGGNGLTLASTARLTAGTTGYAAQDSRQAKGGDVTLGIADAGATLTVASGAVIDVAAKNTADRLVAVSVKDPVTFSLTTAYRLASGDQGGTVTFRAPLTGADNIVDLQMAGTITGARSVTLDAFKVFNLDAIAAANTYAGITSQANGIHLDAAATGKPNFLADLTAAGTLPAFIRNFSVARKDGGSLDGYRLRPEVVLQTTQSLYLDSNINLGAGRITDYAAAVADGLLVESPLGRDAAGNVRYQVAEGKEGDLFARYVDMAFRVGGKVTGEAGVFTFRAGGNLVVANSISDGFFSFHDRTSADYINYQLGGSDRVYHPAVQIVCANGSTCDNTILSYSKFSNRVLPDDFIAVIDLTAPERGEQATPTFIHSPFSASANSVAANGTGNAIGTGELFPLVGGQAVHSSDLRLVAGARADAADPLTVNAASRGSVLIAGEKSYEVVAKPRKNSLGGGIQVGADDGFGTIIYGKASNFITDTLGTLVDPAVASDYYTRLNWGSDDALADATREAALAFFTGNRFVKEDGVVTGVYASLAQVAAFLASDYGTTYAKLTRGAIDLAIDPPADYAQPLARYRPVVRTGDGDIAVAAAGNIALATGKIIYRDSSGANVGVTDGGASAQVGGSAIYTAGTRLATLGLGGSVVNPRSAEPLDYIPSPQGLLNAASVVAGNGGSIRLAAGADVVGRRDVWSEANLTGSIDFDTALAGYENGSTYDVLRIGDPSQRWRTGSVGLTSEIAIVPQLFSSGVGALAGGDVTVVAGRDVNDLTIALDNSVTTQVDAGGARVLSTSASGNLMLSAGRDLLGGSVDVAQGIGLLVVGRAVAAAGTTLNSAAFDNTTFDNRNMLRIRVNDAVVDLTARGDVAIGGIGALAAQRQFASSADALNAAGFFTPIAGVSIATGGTLDLAQNRPEQRVSFFDQSAQPNDRSNLRGYVLPPSLSLLSLSSDIDLGNGNPELLYPSAYGQLSLIAGGDLSDYKLSMSDANASDLPGAFSVTRYLQSAQQVDLLAGLGFMFGGVIGTTDDALLRLLHDRSILHAGDTNPVRIYAGGTMENVHLVLPKAAQVNAGGNIVDFYFEGQNLAASDVTSVVAGGDITATTRLPANDSSAKGRPYVNQTTFILGGPGALLVQAGRNLGPFLNSVTIDDVSYAGGIRTIGNEANPWLGNGGADIYALFGVANGADYGKLSSTYLDPANIARLDGDLFQQVTDSAGNKTPDRAKPIYAPILAAWLRDNEPAAFASVFGTGTFTDSQLATAAWGKLDALYAAFTTQVSAQRQRQFLIKKLYFGEIAAPANPNGPSYLQYIRGYRAIQTLFPATLGYTDNLATYTTDAGSVSTDHPLGEPTKIVVNGEPAVATRVVTGNVDLRLATIQSSRGGDVTILGPGGDFIAGSVVRTSTQAAGKSSPLSPDGQLNLQTGAKLPDKQVGIDSIPIGFEGVLSLRGGAVRSFTDGDFRLNQSRLFTLSGGDITMWSSNGDLNAGQGPKTSSNFPPVVLRFEPNAFSEVDSAGSVSGAGIAALQPTVDVKPSTVILLAPVGTVDAGDAGVRASGDVFVAAARVANADNFKVGGVSVGVPSTAVVAAPAVPNSAAAATAATAAQAGAQQNAAADRRSIIRVDVLGYLGGNGDDCPSGRFDSEGKCIK